MCIPTGVFQVPCLGANADPALWRDTSGDSQLQTSQGRLTAYILDTRRHALTLPLHLLWSCIQSKNNNTQV